MAIIKVHDKSFDIYLPEEKIQQRIKELAADINRDYKGRRPLFIAILNGSFMFASDLFKYLDIEAELCFIKLASYKGMKSSGNVVTSIGLEDDLFGKDVIIVEDIVDESLLFPQIRDDRRLPPCTDPACCYQEHSQYKGMHRRKSQRDIFLSRINISLIFRLIFFCRKRKTEAVINEYIKRDIKLSEE